MKDLKEREQEARARLADQLKRLRAEMTRRPPVAGGVRLRPPPPARPHPEPEQPNWWWQR